MTTNKSLNIIFYSIESVGHIHSGIGMAQVLLEAGHRIKFIISELWKGKLVEYGFEEVVIPQQTRPVNLDPSAHSSDLFQKAGALDPVSPLDKAKAMFTNIAPIRISETKYKDPMLEELVITLKPDLIVMDQWQCVPAVEKSGIPWIYSCSYNPLMGFEMRSNLHNDVLPPATSGLATNGDKGEWKQYRDELFKSTRSIIEDFNSYVVSQGLPPLDHNKLATFSPFMNIYGFPKELDYTDIRPLPPNWYRFDNLKRTEVKGNFEIPEHLKGKPGKLIYFSLGTVVSGDLEMMNRLIGILAESKHRFIVSKGPKHKQIELPDNMWGQQSVPQIQILPVVDLVITHGGNNTITETFYFGKPMIVMPGFVDQMDNAQRVQEKCFGLRMDPINCSKDELLTGIESLLSDKYLNEKLQNISMRIQSENSIAKLPQIIEQRLKDFNKY